MLRTLLVGILAVSAVAACSGKSDPPAAQPGVSAGKVVELTGKVTATRGTDVRTLTEGGEISSDDVIDTAADSRVVILVAHNNARWDLGPNKHGKVADSLAWTAAKVDRPAAVVKEETSTAGRYADKNAATTDTTTRQDRADSEPDMAPKGSPPEPMAVAPQQPGPGGPAKSTAQSTTPPPPATETESSRVPVVAAGGESATREKKQMAPPKMKSAKPGPPATKDQVDDLGDSFGEGDSDQKPIGGERRDGSLGIKPQENETPNRALQLEIRKSAIKERPAIAACIEAPTERLIVTITVKAGVYSLTSTDPAATDKTRACLAKIAKRLTSTTKLDAAVSVRMTVVK